MNDRPVFLHAVYGNRFFLFLFAAASLLPQRLQVVLWGGVCFLGLTLNNGLLATDKLLLGPEVDLFTWRLVVALIATMVLLYGIISDVD
jgi:Family of unknown function (DUF5985)